MLIALTNVTELHDLRSPFAPQMLLNGRIGAAKSMQPLVYHCVSLMFGSNPETKNPANSLS
jgi:hypothetical protein